MKRVYTKKGDVFFVKTDKDSKKYFQYITNDLTQLNSDVIRAFNKSYPIDTNPELSEIVRDEVAFYTHCIINLGVKMGLCEKAGNIKEVGKLDHILFKDTNDYGVKVGEERIKISHKWYVWKIGAADFSRVNKLEGENRKAEIGIVVNPYDVVERITTGKYSFSYPGYE